MLKRVIYGCSGCDNETPVEMSPNGSFPPPPGYWRKLGFEGGQFTIDLCGQCTEKLLAAVPKLRSTLKPRDRERG